MPLNTESRINFEIPQPRSPPTERMMANTRIRPNHTCSSAELIQLFDISPTIGPKYSAAQMATTNAAIEIASFTKPRT